VQVNDRVSSLKVASGWMVTLYEYPNHLGASKDLVGNVGTLGSAWDERASAMRTSLLGLPCTGGVRVFSDANLAGQCRGFERTSERDLRDRLFNGGLGMDDQISSIGIRNGHQLTLYDGPDFTGTSRVYRSTTVSLGDFNDRAGSLVVTCIYPVLPFVGCPPLPPV
jgi:hypothetical protein